MNTAAASLEEGYWSLLARAAFIGYLFMMAVAVTWIIMLLWPKGTEGAFECTLEK